MMASPKPPVEVVKTKDATWEVRRTDTNERLGSFPDRFFAEMFRDSVLEVTRETSFQQLAA